jgi:UTP:GlnB (protein PII) uridylyltransferase
VTSLGRSRLDDPESDIDLLALTSRRLSCRERDAITKVLFDVGMEFEVVISTLVLGVAA